VCVCDKVPPILPKYWPIGYVSLLSFGIGFSIFNGHPTFTPIPNKLNSRNGSGAHCPFLKTKELVSSCIVEHSNKSLGATTSTPGRRQGRAKQLIVWLH